MKRWGRVVWLFMARTKKLLLNFMFLFKFGVQGQHFYESTMNHLTSINIMLNHTLVVLQLCQCCDVEDYIFMDNPELLCFNEWPISNMCYPLRLVSHYFWLCNRSTNVSIPYLNLLEYCQNLWLFYYDSHRLSPPTLTVRASCYFYGEIFFLFWGSLPKIEVVSQMEGIVTPSMQYFKHHIHHSLNAEDGRTLSRCHICHRYTRQRF